MNARALALALEHPSDFTIQYPPRREYFKECFRLDELADCDGTLAFPQIWEQDELLLYVHVPFCAQKCSYCNFAVDTRRNTELRERYVDALVGSLEALESRLAPSTRLAGIDIGGGTPTSLPAEQLTQLLTALRPLMKRCPDGGRNALSIETTPAIAAAHGDRLQALYDGGVNRVSVGLQSTDAAQLEAMNRGKQVDAGDAALASLRAIGFPRLSVDVIFGLPEQSMQAWQRDLDRVLQLDIDAVTTYDCLYRGKGRAMTRARSTVPSPQQYAAMYDEAYHRLTSAGFRAAYGGLNYSRHAGELGTSAYFSGRLLDGLPYVGIGNYASSMAASHWWFAPYSVDAWLAAVEPALAAGQLALPVSDAYQLPLAERAAKYVLLSLNYGIIDPARFRRAFAAEQRGLHDVFAPQLALALSHGWLRWDGHVYSVVDGQFAAMPLLRSLFYSPEALRWCEEVKAAPKKQWAWRKRRS